MKPLQLKWLAKKSCSNYTQMSNKKNSRTDLRNLANSPDYDEQYDDWYEQEIRRESKTKKREKDRHAYKEDGLFF